ncbi:hypothetical protein PoB_000936600 [Plakobranchus ocellatus]|uniref:Uncharacterized protein n=1 Tax=Plakobranchus ocellatus TaxID=259542 RepID=A0AAV3YI27_9GAST|nr:hypothetical protein PoB_000936600 [Plakobranchus ocellatus]
MPICWPSTSLFPCLRATTLRGRRKRWVSVHCWLPLLLHHIEFLPILQAAQLSELHSLTRPSSELRPPSQSLGFSQQQEDTQSSRSGDTPVPASQTNANSAHTNNVENNSESGMLQT